ncbi:hypothetical protein OH76DRAFT_1484681 [Lentinus brumalis]|uniref:Uncharacterized protein n=1 Tax=Lentinus brumalis TaxID=2498619 RepID=A0A371D4X5_9APHY|nr:hypothetical protein OH76DRAFT_1484681 [Polyporus brumalis]
MAGDDKKKRKAADKEAERQAKKARQDEKRRAQVQLRAVSRTVTKATEKPPPRALSVPPRAPSPPHRTSSPLTITSDAEQAHQPPRGRTRDRRARSLSGSRSSSSDSSLSPPSTPKRKRAQEVSGLGDDEVIQRWRALGSTIKIMEEDNKTRNVSKSISDYHNKARLVGRHIHPFINAHQALTFGLTYKEGDFDWDDEDDAMDEDEDEDEDADADEDADESPKEKRARELADKKELFYQYNALLKTMPDLKTDVHLLTDAELETLADFIQKGASKARGTDTSHLVNRIITYMQIADRKPKKGVPKLPPILTKALRGYGNYHTARALLPPSARESLDSDWETLCESILDKRLHIVAEDWPSFLFDIDMYETTDATLLDCLFRSPLFKMLYKSLWTGAVTAGMDGCRPEKVPGKSPIGVHYKLKEVTPRSLAYTAVLAREVLTAHDWSLMDLDFNNCDFFNSLVALFALPLSPWAKETLDWWSMEVYGNMSARTTKKLVGSRRTTAKAIHETLKAMASAAKKGKMVMRTASSPAPEPSDPLSSTPDRNSSSTLGSGLGSGFDFHAPEAEDTSDPPDADHVSSSSSSLAV